MQTNPAYEVGPHIKADLLSYRIMDERHHQSMSLPVFEVWLEWVDATSGGLLRRLWGIAEQKEGFAFKAEDMEEEITLRIRDVGKDLQVGELLLTLVCSQKREATISKLTSFFSAPSFQAELVEPTSIATVPSAPDSYDPPSLTMLSIARTSHSLLNETLNSTMSMDSLSSSVRSSATSSPLPTRICDPTDRLDHISLPPPLAISETEAALSSNFPSLRIFEVRVVNTFQIRAAEGGGSDSSRLKLLEREAGAFLTYSFDKRCEQEGKDPVSRLWWDADCAILNGRASHRLKFSSATALSSFLNLGITLRLQLPREENRLENDDFEGADTGEEVGEALLDASLLRQVFATTGEFNITLPVVDSTNSIKSSLRLALHHHIEPLILQSTELRSRRSVDNLKRRLSISGDKAAAEGEVSGVFLFLEKAVHVTLNRENVKASSSLHWECNWILPVERI